MEHMLLLQRENKKLKDQLQLISSQMKNEISNLRDEHPNTYIWNISNFSHLIEDYQQGQEIRSPAFWLCGVCWKLRLYPNGATPSHSGYLSLYLERQDDEQNGSTVGNSVVSILFRSVLCVLLDNRYLGRLCRLTGYNVILIMWKMDNHHRQYRGGMISRQTD